MNETILVTSFVYPKAHGGTGPGGDGIYISLVPFLASAADLPAFFAADGLAGFPARWIRLTDGKDVAPVMLPPNTVVEFRAGADVLRSRQIGDASPPFNPGPRWPEVIDQNDLAIPKLLPGEPWVWNDGKPRLSDPQQAALYEWIVNFVEPRLRDVPPDTATPVLDAELVKAYKVRVDDEIRGKEGDAGKLWKAFLDSPSKTQGKIVAQEIYDSLNKFLADNPPAADKAPPFSVPRFYASHGKEIQDHWAELLGLGAQDTYVEQQWNAWKGKIDEPNATKHFGRYMVASERIFWPVADEAAAAASIMLLPLDEKKKGIPGRWTNNRSLLELVFGFTRAQAKALCTTAPLTEIRINDAALSGFVATDFKKLLVDFLAECDAADKVNPPLRLQVLTPPASDKSIGRIYFEPRAGETSPLPGQLNASSVPTGLLDALEAAPLFQMPRAETIDTPFVRQTPQRIALQIRGGEKPEIVMAPPVAGILDAEAALRAPVLVARYPLTAFARPDTHLISVTLDTTDLVDLGVGTGKIEVSAKDLEYLKQLFDSAAPAELWFGSDPNILKKASIDPARVLPLSDGRPAILVDVREADQQPIKDLIAWLVDIEQHNKTGKSEAGTPAGAGTAAGRARLVFTDSAKLERFNTLKGAGQMLLFLRRYFQFHLYNSVEHLYRRFSLDYWHADKLLLIASQFEGSIKTLAFLKPQGGGDPKRLTQRDHLLPKKLDEKTKEGMTKSFADGESAGLIKAKSKDGRLYVVTHEFSTPVSRDESDEEKRIGEIERYEMFRGAGTIWALQVAADDGYGYRHDAVSKDARPIPLGSVVQHPAYRSVGTPEDAAKAAQPRPMLRYLYGSKEGEADKVVLQFSVDYFEQLLHPDTVNGVTPGPRIAELRATYESLMDLQTSLRPSKGSENLLTLVIEGWRFDGSMATGNPAQAADDAEELRPPSLFGVLRAQEIWSFDLTADAEWRKRLDQLLPESFYGTDTKPGFFENLDTLVKDPVAFERDFQFTIPLVRAKWTVNDLGEPPAAPSKPLSSRVNIVRVGLRVERGGHRVPDPGLQLDPENDLHPLRVSPNSQGAFPRGAPEFLKAHPPAAITPAVPAAGDPDLTELRIVAADRAARFFGVGFKGPLSTSAESTIDPPVRTEFGWLERTPSGERDEKWFAQLLGPTARFADRPEVMKDEDFVARFFALPLAFYPLLGAPVLARDAISTNEFVLFLLEVLQDVAEGRTPKINIVPSDSVAQLRAHQDSARRLRGQIAEALAGLTLFGAVDDFEVELANWTGYKPRLGEGEDTPTEVAKHKAILEEVQRLKKPLLDDAAAPIRTAIGAMLGRDLTLYGLAKGFLAYMPRDDAYRDLYNFKIAKLPRLSTEILPGDIDPKKTTLPGLAAVLKSGTPVVKLLTAHLHALPNGASRLSKWLVDPTSPNLIAGLLSEVIAARDLSDVASLIATPNWAYGDIAWIRRQLAVYGRPGRPSPDPNDTSEPILRKRLVVALNRLVVGGVLDEGHQSPSDRRFASFMSADIEMFSCSSLVEGKTGSPFVIDVLEDHRYDDEFEILPAWTLGRTGEDVLEHHSAYDPDPLTDPRWPRRSIEVSVTPHNPEWREWTQAAGETDTVEPIRWLWPMPSRRPPAIPVVVEPLEGPVASTGAGVSPPEGAGDYRRNWIFRFPDTWPVSDHVKYYREEVTKQFDEMKIHLKGYKDLPDCLTELPGARNFWSKEWNDILAYWRSLECYVSQFHFEIFPNGEENPSDLLAGFRNDTFLIDIEEAPLDRSDEAAGSPPPKLPTPDPATLLAAYLFQRRQSGSDVPVPTPMSMTAVIDELRHYLDPANTEALLKPARVDSVKPKATKSPVRHYRLFLATDHPKLIPMRGGHEGDEPWVGTLLEARILRVTSQDAIGPKNKFILRLSFLCASWFRYRVRLKVRRNARDVDNDGDPDIDARFIMESDASAWADNGAFYPRRVAPDPAVKSAGPSDLPSGLRILTPDPTAVTKAEWVTGKSSRLGDPLGLTMKGHPDHWLVNQTRSTGPFPGKAGHVVAVEHMLPLVERYPVPDSARDALATRDSYETRLVGTAPPSGYASLFTIDRSEMPSVAKSFRVTWYSDKEKRYPVLVVDRWPLGWRAP